MLRIVHRLPTPPMPLANGVIRVVMATMPHKAMQETNPPTQITG